MNWGSLEWFQSKCSSQSFNSPSSYFSHNTNGYHHARTKWLSLQVNNLLGPSFSNNSTPSILELGCATGAILNEFSYLLKSDKALGLDFVPEVIQYARLSFPRLTFKVSSFPSIDTSDFSLSFDLIIASEVLYYLSEDDCCQTLSTVNSLLSPHGTFIFSSVLKPGYFTEIEAIDLLSPSFHIYSCSFMHNRLYHCLSKPFTSFTSFFSLLVGSHRTLNPLFNSFILTFGQFLRSPFIFPILGLANWSCELYLRNAFIPWILHQLSKSVAPKFTKTNICILATPRSL